MNQSAEHFRLYQYGATVKILVDVMQREPANAETAKTILIAIYTEKARFTEGRETFENKRHETNLC